MEVEFKVCVSCFTYNHSLYIKDALDGFCMQQTNFPYVCVVVDDASIDGEPDIIKQYLHDNFSVDGKGFSQEETDDYVQLYAKHMTNTNCYLAAVLLKYNHHQIKKQKMGYISKWRDDAKYEAFCEGDDHWIDPGKLQTQFDFMENNPDYGMVYSKSIYLKRDGSSRIYGADVPNLETLFVSNPIPTATVFFRKEYEEGYHTDEQIQTESRARQWKLGDYPLWLYIAYRSKIKCIDSVTSVYNCLEESASHSSDPEKQIAFYHSSYEVKDFFYSLYLPDNKDLHRQTDALYHWSIYRTYMIHGLFDKAYNYFYEYKNQYSSKMKFLAEICKVKPIRKIIVSRWQGQ